VSRLVWRPMARADRRVIIDYIARQNPAAALKLDEAFESKVAQLPLHPKLYRTGRVPGTREIVVRSHYVLVYRIQDETIEVLRVLHSAQQWPPREGAD